MSNIYSQLHAFHVYTLNTKQRLAQRFQYVTMR